MLPKCLQASHQQLFSATIPAAVLDIREYSILPTYEASSPLPPQAPNPPIFAYISQLIRILLLLLLQCRPGLRGPGKAAVFSQMPWP